MEVGRPSVNARCGSWQVAQATVPSTDSLPSKKSFCPSAIFPAVCGLSGGMAASVLSLGRPTCLVDRGWASGPGFGMGGGRALSADAGVSPGTAIKTTITMEARTALPIGRSRPMHAFAAAGGPTSSSARRPARAMESRAVERWALLYSRLTTKRVATERAAAGTIHERSAGPRRYRDESANDRKRWPVDSGRSAGRRRGRGEEARRHELHARRPEGAFCFGPQAHDGRQAQGGKAAWPIAREPLRPLQPAGERRRDVPGQADAGGRAGQAARGRDVAVARGNEPRPGPGEGRFPRRLQAVAPPEPPRGGHGLSQVPYR